MCRVEMKYLQTFVKSMPIFVTTLSEASVHQPCVWLPAIGALDSTAIIVYNL